MTQRPLKESYASCEHIYLRVAPTQSLLKELSDRSSKPLAVDTGDKLLSIASTSTDEALDLIEQNWRACFGLLLKLWSVSSLIPNTIRDKDAFKSWFSISCYQQVTPLKLPSKDSQGNNDSNSNREDTSSNLATQLGKQLKFISRENERLFVELRDLNKNIKNKVTRRTSHLTRENNHLSTKYQSLVESFDRQLKRNTSDLERENSKLRDEAATDALTGVLSRRYLIRTLEREVEIAKSQNSPLAILIFDIDHFKKINDAHGHPVGDIALKKFSSCIRSMTRKSDFLGRIGGEEFCIILPGTQAKSVVGLAERMRVKVSKIDFITNGVTLHMTTSIGAAIFTDKIASHLDLLSVADRALYSAKESGRNKLVIYGH